MSNVMIHQYLIGFEKKPNSYRLLHYNTPWDNERELEDLRLIFEGKDLNDNNFPAYKVLNWESLEDGKYEASIEMRFIPNRDGKSYDQLFLLQSVRKEESKHGIG